MYSLSVLNSANCYSSLSKILITWIFASKTLTSNTAPRGQGHVSDIPRKTEEFFHIHFTPRFTQIVPHCYISQQLYTLIDHFIFISVYPCTSRLTNKYDAFPLRWPRFSVWGVICLDPLCIFYFSRTLSIYIISCYRNTCRDLSVAGILNLFAQNLFTFNWFYLYEICSEFIYIFYLLIYIDVCIFFKIFLLSNIPSIV